MRDWAWCDFATLAHFAPWRETGLLMSKTGEQSENVYENKGQAQKSTTAGLLSSSRRGTPWRAPTTAGGVIFRRGAGVRAILRPLPKKNLEKRLNVRYFYALIILSAFLANALAQAPVPAFAE